MSSDSQGMELSPLSWPPGQRSKSYKAETATLAARPINRPGLAMVWPCTTPAPRASFRAYGRASRGYREKIDHGSSPLGLDPSAGRRTAKFSYFFGLKNGTRLPLNGDRKVVKPDLIAPVRRRTRAGS